MFSFMYASTLDGDKHIQATQFTQAGLHLFEIKRAYRQGVGQKDECDMHAGAKAKQS
jgi:hypothetical protein